MILDALVSQLGQRFEHEKRARVCLWFDEKQEFARLLPALRDHLAAKTPPPFVLLEYDASNHHGQVWLKYRIHQIVSATPSEERKRLRFVLYLPLSEDCLDAPERDDDVRLDLLAEYRVAGVIWRVGGRRPSLFSFLRQAGVALSDSATDQRRLYEGGRDSLLAKYVAKFVDRPAAFWATRLTPELAQSRLIGDLEQTILELAMAPEATWGSLRERGLARDFRDMLRDRYGIDMPTAAVADFVLDLVSALALTETYLGYNEPADFPFVDRIPPLALRSNHTQLLHRWLRDTEYRPVWDRLIQAVETKIDLSAWAKGRPGLSFGFPHLVRQRWQATVAEFQEAAPKASTTGEFFARHGATIAREAEFARASFTGLGVWDLLADLRVFVAACAEAEAKIDATTAAAELVRLYVEYASVVERRHVEIRRRAEEQMLPAVAAVADRAYASYANVSNDAFAQRLAAHGSLDIPGVPRVTVHLQHAMWNVKGRRAVVIVDALRYDCALAIRDLLQPAHSVTVEPMLAELPTITPVGMTALLPLSGMAVSLEIASNGLHPKINGKDMSVRDNRLALLKAFGADCRGIKEVENTVEAPAELGDLLVLFGHDDVDDMGHGDAQRLIRHVQLEIDRLARLLRKLHTWGYAAVHVVTDHGFILLDESKLPSEVSCDQNWCQVLKERFALVPAAADLPLIRLPFAWDGSVRVAVPPGLAFFKAEKSFSHGGATLQELVIPHLVSRPLVAQAKRVGVEVVLPTFELHLTSAKVTLRAVLAGASPQGQMPLFSETGRNLALDVLRPSPQGERVSVLAGKPREVRLEAAGKEHNVTLFFHSAAAFSKGELLDLDIRDAETGEQFPPGGIKLTVGRDM